jgi:hypothetical protein
MLGPSLLNLVYHRYQPTIVFINHYFPILYSLSICPTLLPILTPPYLGFSNYIFNVVPEFKVDKVDSCNITIEFEQELIPQFPHFLIVHLAFLDISLLGDHYS